MPLVDSKNNMKKRGNCGWKKILYTDAGNIVDNQKQIEIIIKF